MASSTINDNRISVTICGDGGCGKSSITLRLVRSQFAEEYDPTIEDSYSVTRKIDGQTYQLYITDTAGQEEYRGLFSSSNLHSDAFLLVYDITNLPSLSHLQRFIDLITIETEERLDRGAIPPVKMVVGNKCDLAKEPGFRLVEAATGLNWAKQRGCGFMETSAREQVNIEETFAQIIRRVMESRRQSGSSGADNDVTKNPYNVALSGHAQGMTRPLTPLSEKGMEEERRRNRKPRWWEKFWCW